MVLLIRTATARAVRILLVVRIAFVSGDSVCGSGRVGRRVSSIPTRRIAAVLRSSRVTVLTRIVQSPGVRDSPRFLVGVHSAAPGSPVQPDHRFGSSGHGSSPK